MNLGHLNEKAKKSYLIMLLNETKLDKLKIKEHFLENHASVPQEHRLATWKSLLGIGNILNVNSDSGLKTHYQYLKRIISQVIQIKFENDEALNYYIYLLDNNNLPLNDYETICQNHSFFLVYRQMSEILDDPQEYECYYLTSELYEYLEDNLKSMLETVENHFNKDNTQKNLITDINLEQFLKTGLACVFKEIKIYQIIWDRLIMGETEMLVYTFISLIESCKEEQLKMLRKFNYSTINSVQKIGLDESKILKKSVKYYKNFNSNISIQNLILNYFNAK